MVCRVSSLANLAGCQAINVGAGDIRDSRPACQKLIALILSCFVRFQADTLTAAARPEPHTYVMTSWHSNLPDNAAVGGGKGP
jgi:hypothetical protein